MSGRGEKVQSPIRSADLISRRWQTISKPWFLMVFLLCILALHCSQHLRGTYRMPWKMKYIPMEYNSIGTVKWFECEEWVRTPGTECGSVVVPLDHLNHSVGTSTIALARFKATSKQRRGTIFINPGGPGGSGVDFVINAMPLLIQMFGPYYDIVGFDPRGIGKTVPTVRCFPKPARRHYFISNTVFEQGFTVSSNLSDPHTRDHLVEQYKEFLTLKRTQAELCARNVGDNLKYMGTTTVARDIDFMTTIMDGEESPINFFGGSYGTILGAYLVNMFPDRVGRVAIDGVANPVLWADKPSQYWHRDWIVSAEDTYQIFLKECAKVGHRQCPLAKFQNEDPKEIEKRIDDFLDKLYDSPLPVPYARRPGYLTAGAVRAILLIGMEVPTAWPRVSMLLAMAMAGDGVELLNVLLPLYYIDSEPQPDLSSAADLQRLAVTCLDSPPPESASDFPTPEELADIGLGTIRDVSRHFGMSVSISEPDGGCQFWPVRPKERFTGPWNHTLKNPILIVSNTADPVTPLRSGKLVNTLLGNSSRLLIQDSPGHCSLALASLCTLNAYRAYFINGTLPPNEFVCSTDQSPFPGKYTQGQDSIQIDRENDTSRTSSKGEAVMLYSKEEARLLDAAMEAGEWFFRQKLETIFGPLGSGPHALLPSHRSTSVSN